MPVVPFIGPAIGAISAIGSAIGGSGSVQNGSGIPGGDTGALRDYVMQMLMGGKTTPGTPGAALTVDPSASLAGTNGLFEATRATALAQAKESAGNLTGSGYNNLFGSALATSLAQQQKQLADTTLAAGEDNQKTWAQLFGQFGNQGVNSGTPYYQPSGIAGLAGTAGPIGTLAGMFPHLFGGGSNSGTTGLANSPFAQAGPQVNSTPIAPTNPGWQPPPGVFQ